MLAFSYLYFPTGVVGASTSGDVVALSGATVPQKIPLVSYEATATQLTVSGKYPNFMRTISPDGPLMEVRFPPSSLSCANYSGNLTAVLCVVTVSQLHCVN